MTLAHQFEGITSFVPPKIYVALKTAYLKYLRSENPVLCHQKNTVISRPPKFLLTTFLKILPRKLKILSGIKSPNLLNKSNIPAPRKTVTTKSFQLP